MSTIICFSLLINCFFAYQVYKRGFLSRKLYSDRFAMILSSVFSGGLNFSIGLHLFLLFPNQWNLTVSVSIVIGIITGLLIGAIITFQSLLAGFFNGVVGALMGTMLGAILIDPSLCKLPVAYGYETEQGIYIILAFIATLTMVTFGLLYSSFRV